MNGDVLLMRKKQNRGFFQKLIAHLQVPENNNVFSE